MREALLIFIITLFLTGISFGMTSGGFEQSFGIETSSITYQEKMLMQESGSMNGLNYSATLQGKQYMAKFELRYSSGVVDYDGHDSGGNKVIITGIPDIMWEGRVLGGPTFHVFDASALTTYFGFGYRYLNDNSQEQSDGGYKREANYYYSPIGIQLDDPLSKEDALSVVLEYDLFLAGRQLSYLSDANIGFHDVVNSQRMGYGYKGSISYIKKLNSFDLELKLFGRYWSIADSEYEDVIYYGAIIGEAWEPTNTSSELGFSLGAVF